MSEQQEFSESLKASMRSGNPEAFADALTMILQRIANTPQEDDDGTFLDVIQDELTETITGIVQPKRTMKENMSDVYLATKYGIYMANQLTSSEMKSSLQPDLNLINSFAEEALSAIVC
jgi:hypothetical protein